MSLAVALIAVGGYLLLAAALGELAWRLEKGRDECEAWLEANDEETP